MVHINALKVVEFIDYILLQKKNKMPVFQEITDIKTVCDFQNNLPSFYALNDSS